MSDADWKRRPLALIGSAIGWGSSRLAGEGGPAALRAAGLDARLRDRGIDARWFDMIEARPRIAERGPVDHPKAHGFVRAHIRAVAAASRRAWRKGLRPVTLGGDNSGSIGHYHGLAAAMPRGTRLGLVWCDAHPDCNTLETSPSMAAHGMVVSALMGYGPRGLQRRAGPVFRAEDVALLGIRSIDPGEAAFIRDHRIHAATAEAARGQGVGTAFTAARETAARHTTGYAVSIDLDVIDPSDAPGVGFPEPDGLPLADLVAALEQVRDDPRFVTLEISEYFPEHDTAGRTIEAVVALLGAAFAP